MNINLMGTEPICAYPQRRSSRILFSVAWLITFCLLTSSQAQAETFTVEVRVFCPASLQTDAGGNPVVDASGNLHVDASFGVQSMQWVPCSGVMVTALDSDTFTDEYCGMAYTDSTGWARFTGRCSDLTGKPDVYLVLSSVSPLGFSVGTHDYTWWDAVVDGVTTFLTGGLVPALQAAGAVDLPNFVMSHESARWITEEVHPSDGATLNWGNRVMGEDFRTTTPATSNNPPLWAARQFWATTYAMQMLRTGTLYRPHYFYYTVDHAFFGSPTTIWDTIIVDEDNFRNQAHWMLRATPHEIGHVIHNRYHGSYHHWITSDALSYAREHQRCVGQTHVLGWYEGFANFIENYVFRAEPRGVVDWTSASSGGNAHTYSDVEVWAGCAGNGSPGFHVEGNVEDFLNTLYYGPEQRNLNVNANRHASEFSCSPGFARRQVGNSWMCEKERLVMCRIGQETLLVDYSGTIDACEYCPSQELTPPLIGDPPQSSTPPDCPPGSLCVANPSIFAPGAPGVPYTPPQNTGSSSVTITINPDGSSTSSGNTAGNTNSPEDGSSNSEPTCSTRTVSCDIFANGTGSFTLQHQTGHDVCLETRTANWTPPANPAAPSDLRLDGTEGEVIAATTAGPREWFALPVLDEVIQFVDVAGSGPHRLQEFWGAVIGDWCRSARDPWGRKYFCHPDASAIFRQDIDALGTLHW